MLKLSKHDPFTMIFLFFQLIWVSYVFHQSISLCHLEAPLNGREERALKWLDGANMNEVWTAPAVTLYPFWLGWYKHVLSSAEG